MLAIHLDMCKGWRTTVHEHFSDEWFTFKFCFVVQLHGSWALIKTINSTEDTLLCFGSNIMGFTADSSIQLHMASLEAQYRPL